MQWILLTRKFNKRLYAFWLKWTLVFLLRYRKTGDKLYPIGLEQNIDDEFDEAGQVDFISGRCRTLESFDATSELETPGLLSVEKGEELLIIQKDLGSGWTCVQSTQASGYVPTSILYFFWSWKIMFK